MLGRNTEHTRTLRKTLVCTLLLSILLITLLNIKSVYAIPVVSLSSPTGIFGDTVHVTGTGFFVGDTSCTISGAPVARGTASCTITVGTVSGSFVVGSTQANDYLITVTGFPGPPSPPPSPPVPDFAQAQFEIYLSLSPISGQIGSIIEVFGASFSLSDTTCSLSGAVIGKFVTCVIDSANGTLSGAFTVANVLDTPPTLYPVMVTGFPGGDSKSI